MDPLTGVVVGVALCCYDDSGCVRMVVVVMLIYAGELLVLSVLFRCPLLVYLDVMRSFCQSDVHECSAISLVW